ncbi:MAG TPA: metallophosphoesterase [Solirubrobacteraceae bacterium]|jgi:hypothetical protein
MRTLVVSDFHLGSVTGRDMLRHRRVLEPLREAVAEADRLVLLGDIVELAEGRPRRAMAAAREPLATLAAALGRGREIVVVPGNHDHALVRPFVRGLRAGGRTLGLATRVPATASPVLAALVAALRPARVRVQYPGAWLAPGVYAHHGHYVDRHLLPRARGVLARGPLAPVPASGATPGDYERGGRPPTDDGFELPEVVTDGLDVVSGAVRQATVRAMPFAGRLLRTETVAPRSAAALGWQFRRAGLPAIATVADGLGIRARHLIFGHLHRAGPLPGDDPAEWRARGGRTALHNTGSWVYEPLLLTGVTPPHPYWPGGAIVLEDDEPPRVVKLLDGVRLP